REDAHYSRTNPRGIFLGILLTIGNGGEAKVVQQRTSKGKTIQRRSTGWAPILKAPSEKLIQRLSDRGFCDVIRTFLRLGTRSKLGKPCCICGDTEEPIDRWLLESSVHGNVPALFGGERLVLLSNQDLASYPTRALFNEEQDCPGGPHLSKGVRGEFRNATLLDLFQPCI